MIMRNVEKFIIEAAANNEPVHIKSVYTVDFDTQTLMWFVSLHNVKSQKEGFSTKATTYEQACKQLELRVRRYFERNSFKTSEG